MEMDDEKVYDGLCDHADHGNSEGGFPTNCVAQGPEENREEYTWKIEERWLWCCLRTYIGSVNYVQSE